MPFDPLSTETLADDLAQGLRVTLEEELTLHLDRLEYDPDDQEALNRVIQCGLLLGWPGAPAYRVRGLADLLAQAWTGEAG